MNNLGNYIGYMVQGIVGLAMTAIAFVAIKLLIAFALWVAGFEFLQMLHNEDATAVSVMVTLIMAISVIVGVHNEDN